MTGFANVGPRARWRTVLALVAALSALALSACGSDSESASAGGSNDGAGKLPAEIPVTFVGEFTGPVGYAGQSQLDGIKAAVSEVNASDALEGSKLVLTEEDNGSDPKRSATLMAQTANSDAVAVFGPMNSANTMAAGPLAQREKLPYIATAPVADGVLEIGDMVYRTMPSQKHYENLNIDEAAKRGVKSIKLVYLNDNPTLKELATEQLPERMKSAGIELEGAVGIPTATTDFGPVVARLTEGNPDAIGLMVIGAGFTALIKEIRASGYEGELFGNASATVEVVAPAGKAADGFFATSGFDPKADYEETATFMAAMKKHLPDAKVINQYHAAGWDAVQFLVKAINASGDASREGVHEGMQQVASEGFDSTNGPVKFIGDEKRDATAPGMVVEFQGGQTKIIATGDPNKDVQ